ncbi:MAG: DUF4013 domain-containing protein [Anaerolineae bacterium]
MDIGKSFTYVFDDENWVTKILIGALFVLLSFIVIGIPFILGYMVETLKNVMDGNPRPLPDWADLGPKFTKGLMLFLILLIYSLPIIFVSCLSWMGAVIAEESEAIGAFLACMNCLSVLWGFLVAVVAPAATIRYAITGEFISGFQFGEIFNFIANNLANYIIAFLLSVLANFIGGFGVILCGVGVLFTGLWASLVEAHLFGQVYRASETQTT